MGRSQSWEAQRDTTPGRGHRNHEGLEPGTSVLRERPGRSVQPGLRRRRGCRVGKGQSAGDLRAVAQRGFVLSEKVQGGFGLQRRRSDLELGWVRRNLEAGMSVAEEAKDDWGVEPGGGGGALEEEPAGSVDRLDGGHKGMGGIKDEPGGS